MLRWPLHMSLVLSALLWSASAGGQTIDEAMAASAEEIASLGVKEIAIEGFHSPNSSAGPRIALALRTALVARSVAINDRAEYRVAGTFEVQGKTTSGKAGLHMTIAAKLSREGSPVRMLQKQLASDSDIIGAVSTAGWIPSKGARVGGTTKGGDPQWLEELFTPGAAAGTAAEAPPMAVIEDGRIVRPSATSPFGIEVLRQGEGRLEHCRVLATEADGISKVGVGLADVLAFGVHNNSGVPVGVALYIDGINILHFSKEWSQLGKWYLASHDKGTPAARFTGWHIQGNKANAFQVQYPDALASLLGEHDTVQTISVVFYKVMPSKSEAITIGQGAQHDMPIQQVGAEFFSVPQAIINLRYEALANPAIQP